jgi:polyhydroxyalkanoate synthesis regulator phasin
MLNNTSGAQNIALGISAGVNLTTGNFNIDIGSPGAAGDAATIRIGVPSTQKATYVAGIATSQVTGAPVYVTSSGQLGVLASSERYKTDIESLNTTSQKLSQLRPVSFHLKSEPTGAVQYGLIAEEVDKVCPELVIRDDKGEIQGVRYDELAPMLVNVVQQQQTTINSQAEQSAAQDASLHAQAAEIRDLKLFEQQKDAAANAEIRQLKQQLSEIRAELITLGNKDQLVAKQ